MDASRPNIIDLTRVLVCYLHIQYDEYNDKLPVTIITDKLKISFDFYASFGPKQATIDNHDVHTRGNMVSIQPQKKHSIHKIITVCMKSPVPTKVAVSFTYTKFKNVSNRRQNPFRKEEIERISMIHKQVKVRVMERKRESSYRINHIENNIVSQSVRVDRDELSRSIQSRSAQREKKQTAAIEISNTHTFEKMKTALVRTYAHDMKLYKEDQEFKKNFKNHLKKAIAAIWIHLITFVECSVEIREKAFQERYKLLKENLKKSKQAFAIRLAKEAIHRFRSEKPMRDLERVHDCLQISVKMIDIERSQKNSRSLISNYILNSTLVQNTKRKATLFTFVDKSIQQCNN